MSEKNKIMNGVGVLILLSFIIITLFLQGPDSGIMLFFFIILIFPIVSFIYVTIYLLINKKW